MKAILLLGHTLFGYLLFMPGCGKDPGAGNKTAPLVLPAQEMPPGPRVGLMAPEVGGPDLQGVPFKLSDYRGKVVLLDFWGEFCPPCRALYPHEKALVNKYQDRPFALLGVNADGSVEEALDGVAKNQLNWRSWHDPDGSIAKRYQIRGYPSFFLIDAKGFIRAIPSFGPSLMYEIEREVEKLVKETESGKS